MRVIKVVNKVEMVLEKMEDVHTYIYTGIWMIDLEKDPVGRALHDHLGAYSYTPFPIGEILDKECFRKSTRPCGMIIGTGPTTHQMDYVPRF